MDIELSKVDLPSDARPHDAKALEQLKHDMQKQGQLQEIIVESRKGRYVVIAGVGRTLAARKLGWKKIRASIKEGISEFDRARITFAENEDREEVDAFYQAYQISKMIAAKKCTQQALARELGVSEGTVSAYCAIHGLPAAIHEKFKRLNLGQLIQIARLKHGKSQIALAQKCHKNDLSVRQVQAVVDRKLRNAASTSDKSPQAAAPQKKAKDPLEALWGPLAYDEKISSIGLWDVSYGPHPRGKQVIPGNGWHFWVANASATPKEDLARWLHALANAINGNAERPTRDAGLGTREDENGPSLTPPFSKGLPSPASRLPRPASTSVSASPDTVLLENARLPKTPAEQAELEKLAVQGPAAVYAWIYGPENFLTQQMKNATWDDLEVKDPVKGTREILEGIKA